MNSFFHLIVGEDISVDLNCTSREDQKNNEPTFQHSNLFAVPKYKIKDIREDRKQKLCEMMDKEEPFFRDWRMLAQECLIYTTEKVEQLLGQESSPTQILLQRIQEESVEKLIEVLLEIKRADVVCMLLECPAHSEPRNTMV